jgi:hypothetical protein
VAEKIAALLVENRWIEVTNSSRRELLSIGAIGRSALLCAHDRAGLCEEVFRPTVAGSVRARVIRKLRKRFQASSFHSIRGRIIDRTTGRDS